MIQVNLQQFAYLLNVRKLTIMKKLSDFKNQSLENLESIQGGKNKGKFVHSDGMLFNLVTQDVFYDKNDNGKLDEEELSSWTIVFVDKNS